jgi:hypothetical protein
MSVADLDGWLSLLGIEDPKIKVILLDHRYYPIVMVLGLMGLMAYGVFCLDRVLDRRDDTLGDPCVWESYEDDIDNHEEVTASDLSQKSAVMDSLKQRKSQKKL